MKFREAVTLLLHQEPLICEVVVQLTTKLEDDEYGECTFDSAKPRIEIRISRALPLVAQLDALIHEWAHAMLAGMPEEFHKHGPLWGVCFARCYCAVYPT